MAFMFSSVAANIRFSTRAVRDDENNCRNYRFANADALVIRGAHLSAFQYSPKAQIFVDAARIPVNRARRNFVQAGGDRR